MWSSIDRDTKRKGKEKESRKTGNLSSQGLHDDDKFGPLLSPRRRVEGRKSTKAWHQNNSPGYLLYLIVQGVKTPTTTYIWGVFEEECLFMAFLKTKISGPPH